MQDFFTNSTLKTKLRKVARLWYSLSLYNTVCVVSLRWHVNSSLIDVCINWSTIAVHGMSSHLHGKFVILHFLVFVMNELLVSKCTELAVAATNKP